MLRILLRGRDILPMLAAFAVLMASSPAWALTTGKLRVYVQDQEGMEIPSVALTLEGEQLIGGAQERVTNDDGMFLFVELPPGLYSLRAVKAGFQGVTTTEIQVNVNTERKIFVEMPVGEETTEIEVVEKQLAVDTTSTSRSQVLTKEFLQKIPTGRSYQQAVNMASGVTGGGDNMAGSASNENTYMLDGANITDPVTGTFSLNFNFDAIQQIEVLLGGYMPEYGTSVGGIVNVVTESGTNNLEFETTIFYGNGNWRPRTDERISADGTLIAPGGFDSTDSFLQVAAKVAGPLIRDRAWFIISYQHARSRFANSGVPQERDFDGHYLLSKLTVSPSTEHRLTFFMQTNPTAIDNVDQGDPYITAEAQGRQAQGGFVANGRWQWFLSPELNLDTALLVQKIYIEVNAVPCTHNRQVNYHPCRPGEQEGEVDWETPGRFGFQGAYSSVNYGQYYFDDRWRYQASSKLSVLSVEDPLGGTHDFKFGVEGIQTVWDQIQGLAGNQRYLDWDEVPFDPETYSNYGWTETSGPIKFRTTASEYNFFAQDSWKPVSNLTINYGSRFDSFVTRNDIGEPVLSGTLLGPRLFAAWDPWKDQKTKVATGWGRFNDTGRLGIAGFTSNSNIGSKFFLGEWAAGGGLSGYLNNTSDNFSVTPQENLNSSHDNLRTPRVDELILTLERELVEDVAAFSSMSGKFTRFMYEYDDTNLIYDSDGSSMIGSRLGDASQSYFRLRTPALAKRDYFQWDIGLRKVTSKRWGGQATYTYSQSVGSTTTALSGSFANDPQTQYNYGPLNTDQRHVVKSQGFWDIPTDPWKQTIGVFFSYYSSFPRERLYYSEGGGLVGGYDLRIRPRGTYTRFNSNWTFDFQFSQDIDVRKGAFQLFVIVRNVFNNREPEFLQPSAIHTQNRFVTTARQDAQNIMLGARYTF